ncbi:Pali-domain-containing protein [Mycena sanguinolenta]|uniref:Pali-domain-containing protein n=1 Tax=Mycena sanguinolenta TaxID=230812 RepID=A0A8H7DJ25_9AGAR|nr:Pali-domain-containing protein [Mycena sanguinolenta]
MAAFCPPCPLSSIYDFLTGSRRNIPTYACFYCASRTIFLSNGRCPSCPHLYLCLFPFGRDKIFFLDAGSGDAIVRFGVFGFTGNHARIGYRFNPSSLNFNDHALHTPVFLNLTKTLILHPIAAGMSGLAFFCGLSGIFGYRAGTAFMALLAALATIVSLMAFLFDMVLFGIVRRQFREQGISSQYGNACWLTLAALVAILLGFSTAASTFFLPYCNKKRKRSTVGI